MKATIDESGCLTVEAENPLEAYALKKWNEEFRPGTEHPGRSMLMIRHSTQQQPGDSK